MIYAVTPCGRPDNLVQIMQTIPKSWKWIICYDDRVEIPKEVKEKAILLKCEYTGPAGVHARNYILDNYDFQDDDWILQLDDDNIIHPDIEAEFQDIEKFSEYAVIAFCQGFWNGDLRMQPSVPPQIGRFDVGSYIVQWKYVKEIRYPNIYCHDQVYLISCVWCGLLCGSSGAGRPELHTPPPLGVINKILCYYNYIDKEDWSHPKYREYRENSKKEQLEREKEAKKRGMMK